MSGSGDTLPKRLLSIVEAHPEKAAVMSKDAEGVFQPITYKEMKEIVAAVTCAFHSIGIKRGDHIGLIADNRKEWYIADQAILSLGAADVPRGTDTTPGEIEYILAHADCRITIAETKAMAEKILERKEKLKNLEKLIVFDDDGKDISPSLSSGVELLLYSELLAKGKELHAKDPGFFVNEVSQGKPDDIATIIYTSGTTGEPKGVLLTHLNYTFQLDRVYDHIDVQPGHIFLSVLPIWHSFERAVDYIVMNFGATVAYSKLVGSIMLEDFQKVQPHWMTSAPRIWEMIRNSIYKKIKEGSGAKKAIALFLLSASMAHASLSNLVGGRLPEFKRRVKFFDFLAGIIPFIIFTPLKALGNALVFKKIKAMLGGRFLAGISGGGALPPYVDNFFQAAGILLLEGYGLTETAPVLAVRKRAKPIVDTVGPLLKDIQYKVVDKEGNEVGPGKKGVLYIKSDQVMKGYYKRPDATEAVLKDGWLNTGDIVIATIHREIKIVGRAKETIVLLGGENIEPNPIEEKLAQSELIDQVMVLGQDQKFLAALIIPSKEALEAAAQEKNIPYQQYEDLVASSEVHTLINDEVQELISGKNGFKTYERVFRIKLLPNPFEVGKEMTQTLKVKRDVVNDTYKKEIKALFV